MFEIREPLEDRAGGCDRVAAVEERPLGELRGCDKTQHRGLVPHQHAVVTRLELCLADGKAPGEDLDGVGIIVAGGQGFIIGLEDLGHLAEFFLHQAEGRLEGSIVHPQHDAKGEHVLAAAGELVADAGVLDRLEGEAGERNSVYIVAFEVTRLPRILLVACLLQIVLTEGVRVENDGAAANKVTKVDLQGCRVHRHQHLRSIPGGHDLQRAEIQLEPADAGKGAGRGTNLGREIRQGADVVAGQGRVVGKERSRDLHPIARVASEANDYLVDELRF